MSELSRLQQEHTKLAGLFRRLRNAIESADCPSQVELFELRRQLVSTLLAHLKLEDWALYPRLIQSDQKDFASTGQAFKDEMGGLAPAFLAYSEKWNANSISADWSSYCADTRAVLDALENRLEREDRDLFPLLERLDRAA